MDLGGSEGGIGTIGGALAELKKKELPDDLPRSLDDRRRPVELVPETEIYDGWQGQFHRVLSRPHELR